MKTYTIKGHMGAFYDLENVIKHGQRYAMILAQDGAFEIHEIKLNRFSGLLVDSNIKVFYEEIADAEAHLARMNTEWEQSIHFQPTKDSGYATICLEGEKGDNSFKVTDVRSLVTCSECLKELACRIP